MKNFKNLLGKGIKIKDTRFSPNQNKLELYELTEINQSKWSL